MQIGTAAGAARDQSISTSRTEGEGRLHAGPTFDEQLCKQLSIRLQDAARGLIAQNVSADDDSWFT